MDSVPSLYCNPGNNPIHFLSGTSPYVTISWLPIRREREREGRRPHLSKLLILNEWLFSWTLGVSRRKPYLRLSAAMPDQPYRQLRSQPAKDYQMTAA